MEGSWQITIANFEGLVPGFFTNQYTTFGNKGHASDMQNIDLMDQNVLTQGPGLATLTAGSEAGAVTTLIKGIQKISVAGTNAYAIGGNKLYQFTVTGVTSDATWPHTIDKGTVTGEDGEDVCYYNGNTYYSYNHSGTAGDIGRYTGAAFDDDYGCYSEDTEVMTVSGWKKIKDVRVGEKVYSMNPRTQKVEIVKNIQTINKKFSGEIIHFQSEGVDVLVTPDHKMFAGFRKMEKREIRNDYRVARADSLVNYTNFRLKKNAEWTGKIVDMWEIPEYDNGATKKNGGYCRMSRRFPIKPFLRLLGFYLAEGSSNQKCFNISQKIYSKGWKPIKETLDELGLSYGYYGGQQFDIHDKQLTQYIRSIVPSGFYHKTIPREIMELHPSLLIELYEAMMLGDGSGEWQYFTSSPFLRDDFVELVNRLGWSATPHLAFKAGTKQFHGTATADHWRIVVNKKKNEQTFNHHKNQGWGSSVKKELYTGNIVCLALEKNHIMLVRRNWKSVWCGNSTVPTGATTLVGSVPHQMIVAGDNKMYIANGRYIASLSITTFVDQAIDFPEGSVVTSIVWNNNRLFAAVVRPYVTGDIYQESSIYIWDTTLPSWEYQIPVPGRITALFARNGITHCWYRDVTSTGGYKLAIVNGNQLQDVISFTGSLPEYYQVIDHKNHILWISSGEVWAWGAVSNQVPTKFFQYADAGHVTAGGITNAFATPMIASHDATTGYKLAKFSGYDVNATWKSILFDLSDAVSTVKIAHIVVYTEPLSTGARVDVSVTADCGGSTEDDDYTLDPIVYDSAVPGKTRWILSRKGIQCESFRLNLDFALGSVTNPVKVRKILISGEYVTNL